MTLAALSLCASHPALASDPAASESAPSGSAPSEAPKMNGTDVGFEAHVSDISWGVSAAAFITTGNLYLLRPEVLRHDPLLDVALLEGGGVGVINLSPSVTVFASIGCVP